MAKVANNPVEAYDNALAEYRWAVKYAAGGGHRGQMLVEHEYDKLAAAYDNLSVEDRTKVIYPDDPRDSKPAAEGK